MAAATAAIGRQRVRRRGFGGFLSTLIRAMLLLGIGAGGAWAWLRYEAEIQQVLRQRAGFAIPTLAGPAPVEVRLATVAPASQSPDTGPVLTATGKIVSDHQVEVATKVSGQIVALFFEQGDQVAEGALLARLEDINYRARRDEAAAQLRRAEATLEFETINFQRIDSLRQMNRSSEIEFADARRRLNEARAQREANQAALAWAEKALRDTEVLAPISGVVLERNVEVGDFVAAEGGLGANANAQFATIADMTKLRVEVDISELDVSRIRRGLPCTIVPDAYKDRRYQGHVMWIDPGANYAKATVQAKVRIEQPDEFLRVEGSAQVQFLREESPAESQPTGVWIQASAVRGSPPEDRYVFVAEGDRLRRVLVTIGRTESGRVQVLAGLSVGQQVVVESATEPQDDQRFRTAPQQP